MSGMYNSQTTQGFAQQGGGQLGQQQPAAGGMFGQPAPAAAGGGMFGQAAGGSAGGGLFGQQPAAAGGMFGPPQQAAAGGGGLGLVWGANKSGGVFQIPAAVGGGTGSPVADETVGEDKTFQDMPPKFRDMIKDIEKYKEPFDKTMKDLQNDGIKSKAKKTEDKTGGVNPKTSYPSQAVPDPLQQVRIACQKVRLQASRLKNKQQGVKEQMERLRTDAGKIKVDLVKYGTSGLENTKRKTPPNYDSESFIFEEFLKSLEQQRKDIERKLNLVSDQLRKSSQADSLQQQTGGQYGQQVSIGGEELWTLINAQTGAIMHAMELVADAHEEADRMREGFKQRYGGLDPFRERDNAEQKERMQNEEKKKQEIKFRSNDTKKTDLFPPAAAPGAPATAPATAPGAPATAPGAPATAPGTGTGTSAPLFGKQKGFGGFSPSSTPAGTGTPAPVGGLNATSSTPAATAPQPTHFNGFGSTPPPPKGKTNLFGF